jgi:signal transduction histidine kinase
MQQYLFPDAERNEKFRAETLRLSRIGLKIIGYTQVSVLSVLLLLRFVITPEPETVSLRGLQALLVIALGAVTLGLARAKWAVPYSRIIAILSGFTMTAILIWFSLMISPIDTEAEDFIPGQITTAILVGVVAIPLRPVQMFLFGAGTGSFYLFASQVVANFQYPTRTPDPRHWLFILILTLLATGLTAVVYSQRAARFFAYQNELAAADDLRNAQLRILLSEHAASLGRLAAAVSHELNSPIGALTSGVDTLLLLAARQATAPPNEQQRLVVLQAELRASVRESASRLQQLVARMQRFTNLDKAEVQAADLNDLLGDVTSLLEPHWKGRAELKLDLQPVPPLVCRPQKLSAVFYNLLNNAIDAVNGNGRIVISTRKLDAELEVQIADNGRGVPSDQLASIFDPGFKSTGERVGTGNWSMFSSRQIVREHGGEIRISSGEGKGTTVRVTLPLQSSVQR